MAIDIPIPDETLRAAALGYVLLMCAFESESDFPGALVWLRSWDIGSETFERVGWRLIRGLQQNMSTTSIQETPAQLFAEGELEDAQAFLLVPMVFRWDAYVIPESGRFLARVDHHQRLQITTRTPALFETMFEYFEEGEWAPRERIAEP